MAQRLWVVPAHKIKMRRPHKVPLSFAALSVLQRVRGQFALDRYVFPSATRGTPMNPRALETVLHSGMGEPYSVHGMRAAFSSWAHECTEFPHELIEMAPAHVEGQGNAVARAYNRSDALERRRALMQAWAGFVTGAQASNVVSLTAPAQFLKAAE